MKRPIVLAVAVIAALLWSAAPAWAHSGLESSDPADGATLSSAPAAVTMTFTETPDPALSAVNVVGGDGNAVQTGSPESFGDAGLRVALPPGLPDGAYTVEWRVVAEDDGHVTAGAFAFGIGVAPQAPANDSRDAEAGTAASPSALSIVGKGLLYLGLMLLVASAVVGLGAFGGRLRSLRAAALAAAILTVTGTVAFAEATRRSVDVSMGELLSSGAGRSIRALLVAVLIITVVAVAWVVLGRRALLWLAGGAAAVAMLIRVDGGHASGADPAWVQEALQWFHFMAAGLWAGGLVLLGFLLRERRNEDPPVRVVRRYSNLAVVTIAVVVLTGLLRSLDELGGLGRLGEVFATSYGTTLVVKVAIALAIVVLGAVNRLRTIPRLEADARPLRRLVGVEILGVVGIVALTATLTGLAPPVTAEPRTHGEPALVRAKGIDDRATTTVEFEAAPGTPGPNDFLVLALRWGTEQPVPADAVTLRFTSVTHPDAPPASVPLTANGDTWTGQAAAPSLPGTWTVDVEIRSGSTTTVVPLVLTTRTPDAEQATSAGGDGQPTIVTTTFPDGSSLQTYVDPAAEGPNQVHVTAFGPDGTELPLDAVAVVAIPGDEPPQLLPIEVLSPGHVVANADLDAGDWTFDVVATPASGGTLQATWTTSVTTD